MIGVIYIRVSDDKTQDEASQIDSIIGKFGLDRSKYLVLGERVTAWNQDKESKRVEFLKLKALVKTKGIKSIYVFDVDRLYRNRKKVVEFYAYCKAYGVSIFSHNQEYLNDLLNISMPTGLEWLGEQIFNNTLNLLGWMAEEESTKKSERVKSKIRIKEDGAFSVYGNKWGRKKISKQAVSKIIDLHKEGLSIRKIADLVKVADSNNNLKNVSKSVVHKIISEFNAK